MSIMVLCPSRDNPAGAGRALASMVDTSTDTRMALCIDDDQEAVYSYLHHPRLIKVVGPRTDIVGSLNNALHGLDYSACGLIVDDAVFESSGWDSWVLKTLSQFPGRIGVVSAAHNVGEFVNFGYVSKEWVDLLGWYACPDTLHFCWDTVLELLGEATAISYAPKDRFYINHDLSRERTTVKLLAEDAFAFLGWCVNDRRRLAFKLREAMA